MSLKAKFPIFSQPNAPFKAYLDNAATTQKPQVVIDAVTNFYAHHCSNVHRGGYRLANENTQRYESARQRVSQFINAPKDTAIVWTNGTTSSINLAMQSWASHSLSQGDAILISRAEHHANFIPWQQLAKQQKLKLLICNVNQFGQIDVEHFRDLMIAEQPRLVAIQHCSNVTGCIQPIEQLSAIARNYNAAILVDGAQAVAHVKVDMTQLDCDFYVFSGHKLYGPTGIGVLAIHPRRINECAPCYFGGEMIVNVDDFDSQFRTLPALLEPGTANISGVLGLRAAIEFVESHQLIEQHSNVTALYEYLHDQLSAIPNIRLLSPRQANIGIACFVIDGIDNSDIAMLLDEQGIAIRNGHHCAMPLLKHIAPKGALRASLAAYSDVTDIDVFIAALIEAVKLLGEVE